MRMVSAKVDIDWGTPCALSAVFVLENTTSKAVEVQLGFPLNLPDKFSDKDKLGFTMAFDDIPQALRYYRSRTAPDQHAFGRDVVPLPAHLSAGPDPGDGDNEIASFPRL